MRHEEEDDGSESRPKIHCPKCGSGDVRRSKSDGIFSGFARMFGRWPFRCRSCRSRFYRHAEPPADLH